MAQPQTTGTQAYTLNGAVKVEVSASAAFTVAYDCGYANGAKLTEELKMPTIETDNTVDEIILADEAVMIEWEQLEALNENALAIMRGSIDTAVVTTTTPVTNHDQNLAAGWLYSTFYAFDQVSYSGTNGAVAVPTNITIVQDPAGTPATLTANTDYYIMQNADGVWGFMILNTATSDNAYALEVEFDYTPQAGTKYYVGGGTNDVPTFYVRLTNTDEDGRIVRYVTTGIGRLSKGYEMAFKKYNADDPRVGFPVSVTVKKDITATAGRQLYYREVIPA